MTHEQDAVEDTPQVCTFSAEKQPQIEAVEKQSQTVEPPRKYFLFVFVDNEKGINMKVHNA